MYSSGSCLYALDHTVDHLSPISHRYTYTVLDHVHLPATAAARPVEQDPVMVGKTGLDDRTAEALFDRNKQPACPVSLPPLQFRLVIGHRPRHWVLQYISAVGVNLNNQV